MIFKQKLKISEIAGIIGGEIIGIGDTQITGVNRIELAGAGELTFCSSKNFAHLLNSSPAGCIIVGKDFPNSLGLETLPGGNNYILTDDAYAGLLRLLYHFESKKEKKTSFIHPTALIDEGTEIHPSAYIGANCVFGKGCTVGEGCIIHSSVIVYDNVKIGRNTVIHANVTFGEDTVIGENCIIHPGAVIGSDGFGFVENPGGSYTKIPQLGNVIVGNNVEIGANTTIDRAVIGSTIIGDGVKLDNLIHIAHNVTIGAHTAMAAQAGVSGSTKIGLRNRFGGQVGLSGHIETADDVTILAQSGVAKSIPTKGIYFGSPIKERLKAFKIEAIINQLPEIAKELNEMKKKLAEK